ncbi:MAG: translocation/assembly module TamB domain-containing protein [Proteobacteria bacterium]|nr:translocation/assembly module TamB domain-containing protein [Pseudomonadota bacterium]
MTTAATKASSPRRRRWLRRILVTGIGATLLFALFASWLLLTASGRDFALARIAATLPRGALTWSHADGTLAGPLALHDLHYRHAGVEFKAGMLRVDPQLARLLQRRLLLDSLRVEQATLDVPIDRTPQPPPRWPDVLPTFDVPIAVDVRTVDIRDLRISRGREPVIAIDSLRGGFELSPGRLQLTAIRASTDRGEVRADASMDARHAYATRMQATWLPQAGEGDARADLRLDASGDLRRFVLTLTGHAPEPIHLDFILTNGQRVPDWEVSAHAERFDPRALSTLLHQHADAAAAPWSVALDAQGHGGRARVQGRIAQGPMGLVVAPSSLDYENGVLGAQPLALDLLDGHARIDGRIDLRPAAPAVDARLQLDGLHWRADRKAEPVQASGELAVQGHVEDWAASGSLLLARAGEQARVAIAAQGDATQADIARFDAATSAGLLQGKASVRWSPALAWSAEALLDRFDPGYFAPGFDGSVSAQLRTSGTRQPASGLVIQIAADGLAGKLRGRPLAGYARFDWEKDAGHVDADLRLGGSHVQAKGAAGARFDLVAHFSPLRLDDVLPDARGTIAGDLAVEGALPTPAVQGNLAGSGLLWHGYGAAHVALDGRIATDAGAGDVSAKADGIIGVAQLHSLHLQFGGSTTQPRIVGALAGALGSLDLSASAQRKGDAWHGSIASLHFAPASGAAWSLQAPATFAYDGRGGLRLANACLRADGASVCAVADWPRQASVQALSLPMAWLDPWIARPDFDAHAWGSVDLDARIAPGARGGWNGNASLRSSSGGIRMADQLAHPLLGYQNLVAEATLAGERVQIDLASDLSAGGSVRAHASSALASGAPLAGEASIDLRDVAWLELFSTDLAAPKGRFGGQFALGGTLDHPGVSGRLQLADFKAELPALGIALTDGQIGIDAASDGTAAITGSLRSGDGTLAIGGGGRWNDLDAPVRVTLKGEKVRVADTPELQALASPDLQLGFAAGTLTLRGSVAVPSARMDLERLDGTVTPSPDVVVLDPRQTTRSSPLKLDVDLNLTLGKSVILKGFGLDGTLAGQLRVRRPPNATMTAAGTLDVGGSYRAYGQQLEIERGRLTYNGGSFDNPALDVLAQRRFEDDDVTVGVRVRGTAHKPQTQIVSTPAMGSTDALAYLVIGRPLRAANSDETGKINTAATALAVGGNLVAASIGARLGLDAGVNTSRALGGEVLSVGKYLSPRLFVSYGVALAGTGEVLTLKYLLRKGFDISVESAKETRASINWRTEK